MSEQDTQLRSLDSLLGEHELSGVDLGTGPIEQWGAQYEDCQVMNFILDGEILSAIEDPGDGYRSSMSELRIVDIEVSNTFQPVRVMGIRRDGIVDFVDTANNKVILSVGTDSYDDYYPMFIATFTPENMSINEERRIEMSELESTQINTLTEVQVAGPQVQLVHNEQALVASLAEVAPNLDPSTAGDAEIIEAVAYHWDIPVTELSGHQVTRPATGHLLVSEKAVFGD